MNKCDEHLILSIHILESQTAGDANSLGLQITERPLSDQTPEWWMSDTKQSQHSSRSWFPQRMSMIYEHLNLGGE